MSRMIKNMYVRKSDEVFWEWAQQQAQQQGIALSLWLTNLIRVRKYDQDAGRVADPKSSLEVMREAYAQLAQAIEMRESEVES